MKKPELPREFWQKLADVEPYGLTLTPEQVESWFELVWPSYSERRYTAHRRAVASWWSRAYEGDIHRAIERLSRIQERDDISRMEARLPPAAPTNIPDVFLKVVANND